MIISHKHRFIFIKTVKTAGTSIEIGLSKYCGPNDVISLLDPEDEKIRKEFGYRSAQNYHVPLNKYNLRDWKRLLTKCRRKRYKYHMSALSIKKLISNDIWNSYFKFCFERNPWDKVISHYFWKYKTLNKPFPTFSEHVLSEKIDLLSTYFLYSINNEIAVDFIGKYEHLQEDLDYIAEKLNLPGKIILPNAKGNLRKDKRHYREWYNEAEKKKVGEIFQKEISHLGYKF